MDRDADRREGEATEGRSPYRHSSPEAHERAFQQLQAMAAAPSAGPVIPWIQIGPAAMRADEIIGQTLYNGVGQSVTRDKVAGGLYSGRVTAIAIDPTDSNVIYLGADTGGVWKTTNGGGSSLPLTDQQCSLNISDIKIDPKNTRNIYVGTEYDIFGCGMLRSTDGGSTWTRLAPTLMVQNILIDPTTGGSANTTTLYLVTSLSLFKSTDGGATVVPVNALLPGSSSPVNLYSPAMDPTNPAILYALGPPPGLSIFKTIDGAKTWTRIYNMQMNVALAKLAMAPSDPKTIYAVLQDWSSLPTDKITFYKTADAGATWALVPTTSGFNNNAPCDGQCIHDWAFAIDPHDANVIYFGGAASYGLMRSADGGVTWSGDSLFQDVDGQHLHGDTAVLVFDQLGRLYIGDDGGIFRTDETRLHYYGLNSNLAITQVYKGVSIYPGDPRLIAAGTQDNGVILFNGSQQWQTVYGGDAHMTAIDPSNPNTIYSTGNFGYGPIRSDDGFATLPTGAANKGLTSGLGALLVMSPSDPRTLLSGFRSVYRSTDRGDSWQAISPVLDPDGWLTAIAIAPSAASTTFYAGTVSGRVYRTTDSGVSWSELPVPKSLYGLSDMKINHQNPNRVYVTTGYIPGKVYRTNDGGASWVDLTSNLPPVQVGVLAVDEETAPETLYAGTEMGVFVSRDAGINWASFNNGFPYAQVTDLVLNSTAGSLIAATYGRSLFAAAVKDPQIKNSGVANAASFAPGAVAPGEIVTVFGRSVGPPLVASATLDSSGSVSKNVSQTRVLFDGVPAPIINAISTQVSVVVPYAVAGKTATTVQVEYQGRLSNSVNVPVAPAAPGIFVIDLSGQGAIINQDGSVNSAKNPAPKGSIVQIWGTGEGQPNIAVADGTIGPPAKPLLPVTVEIGGVAANVTYAGSAPGLVAGVLQVNVQIPDGAPSGSNTPIVVKVGNFSSQSGVTVAVQ